MSKKVSQVESSFIKRWLRRVEITLQYLQLYCTKTPSHQNAVELFEGEWSTMLPTAEVHTGNALVLENDTRVEWAGQVLGELTGLRVLELGPLEGGHSFQLEQAGAEVLAIESNQRAFLRCLITKNILGLRAQFLLGDFTRYLEQPGQHFDLIFASGVLYHMSDPVQVLQSMAERTDKIFLWTHIYDASAIARHAKLHRDFSTGRATERVRRGNIEVTYHYRVYGPGVFTKLLPGFCGGMTTTTVWMSSADIQATLTASGFQVVRVEENLSHPNGPLILLAAVRKN